MTATMKAWQCIGCGRIEAPQTCIGVCQDRPVELVYAWQYEDALEKARLAQRHTQALVGLVRRLAWTVPRDGKWEDSYRGLQAEARRLLTVLESGEERVAARVTSPAHSDGH
ncbi:hypothetical protein [Pelomicrobium sp.]|jgi:hypothetical protein|uniref:hypothetical protein n=1 Tax=Pelomicrobium sp. TaxID=2815319 RepID=UPI002FDD83EC